MIKIIALVFFTVILFGFFALSLRFSRYKQRDKSLNDPDGTGRNHHRCDNCTCDLKKS